jgi:Protein of unknown function (DUF2786)
MADQDGTLEKVRKLLAKAEAEGVTPPEAEALTAKAAELMARYGIDKARLAATQPSTDQLANRKITVENPWTDVKSHLLGGIFQAMRCQVILIGKRDGKQQIHIFGFTSDLDRAEMLYTSLLVQMALGLAAQFVPGSGGRAKTWRRSWMLGFATAVTGRVKAAEARAADQADAEDRAAGGRSTALVLADRSLAVKNALRQQYPRTRSVRMTYSGSGYSGGHAAGQRADIGGAKVGAGSAAALGR